MMTDRPKIRSRAAAAALRPCALIAALSIGALLSSAAQAAGVLHLITAEEAAIRSDETTLRGRREPLDEGPRIVIESPEDDGVYREPFAVRVFFHKGVSGLPVAMGSLKLVYQKLWGIDITDRVRDYLQGDSIEAPQTELPKGKHTVEIYIEDVEENPSTRLFTVTVK